MKQKKIEVKHKDTYIHSPHKNGKYEYYCLSFTFFTATFIRDNDLYLDNTFEPYFTLSKYYTNRKIKIGEIKKKYVDEYFVLGYSEAEVMKKKDKLLKYFHDYYSNAKDKKYHFYIKPYFIEYLRRDKLLNLMRDE